MILKNTMISCESATLFISKQEENKLLLSDTLKLWLHLAICKFCRLFKIQNEFLIHQLQHTHTDVSLSEKEKVALNTKIISEMKK